MPQSPPTRPTVRAGARQWIGVFLAIFLPITLSSCKDSSGTTGEEISRPIVAAVVTAPTGLVLREQPYLKAKAVGVAPRGTAVWLMGREEGPSFEVDGRSGRYTQVEWQSLFGWMFNGYLEVGGKENPETKRIFFEAAGCSTPMPDEFRHIVFTNAGTVYTVPRSRRDARSGSKCIILPVPDNWEIYQLYWHADATRILIAYEITDCDSGSSRMAWVDPRSLSVYATRNTGFNIGSPVLYGEWVYYISYNAIGKVSSRRGTGGWHIDDVHAGTNSDRTMPYFNDIIFPDPEHVLFKDSQGRTLRVDNATGRNRQWE